MLNISQKKKLILGTASFSKNYGVNNVNNYNSNSCAKVLKYSKKNHISFIDTALSYTGANKILETKSLKTNQVIYKINIKDKNKDIYKDIELQLKKVFKKFCIKKLYCLMLHSENTMSSKNSDQIFDALKTIKEKKLTQKIGISLYDHKKAIKLVKKYKFDIIQIPFNLFDQRINDAKFLKIMNKNKIELHIRSIFLQGLLLMNEEKRPKYFVKWSGLFKKLKDILIKKKIDVIRLSLNHAYNLNYKNKKIIIGVNNVQQLKKILSTKRITKTNYVDKLKTNSKKLIFPYLWPLKKI